MLPVAVKELRLRYDFHAAKRSGQVPFAPDVAVHDAVAQAVVVESIPAPVYAAPVVIDAAAAGVEGVVLVLPAAVVPASQLVPSTVVPLGELALSLFQRLSRGLAAIAGAVLLGPGSEVYTRELVQAFDACQEAIADVNAGAQGPV